MRQVVTFEVEIAVEVDEGEPPPRGKRHLQEALTYASDVTSAAAAAAVALMNDWRWARKKHVSVRSVGFRGPTNLPDLETRIVRDLTGEAIY